MAARDEQEVEAVAAASEGAGGVRASGRGTVLPRLTDAEAQRWLAEHRTGAAPDEALAFFDRLPPVSTAEMLGRWRGSGLPTGSRLDGLLEAYGWYGKEVRGAESVHPLLVRGRDGRPRPLDPRLIPIGLLRDYAGLARLRPVRALFARLRPLLCTDRPRARLRTVEHRGVTTAAMIYDALPIIDVFRRGGPGVVVGAMDMRGLPAPFFFLLERDASA